MFAFFPRCPAQWCATKSRRFRYQLPCPAYHHETLAHCQACRNPLKRQKELPHCIGTGSPSQDGYNRQETIVLFFTARTTRAVYALSLYAAEMSFTCGKPYALSSRKQSYPTQHNNCNRNREQSTNLIWYQKFTMYILWIMKCIIGNSSSENKKGNESLHKRLLCNCEYQDNEIMWSFKQIDGLRFFLSFCLTMQSSEGYIISEYYVLKVYLNLFYVLQCF